MTDLTMISSTLSGIKTAVDIAKYLIDINSSLKNAEMNIKLSDLMTALADAKINIANIQTIIIEKDEKINELEKALEIKGNLRYEAPYYWLDNANGKEGPYCQRCYDKEKALIRLQVYLSGSWVCCSCKNIYHYRK
ncbi:MAG TPA: hypothetical protein PLP19_13290 [bacterium]|nr:hypothetical protein [bacterium]HPN44461.1 hypothetical protein [bacterium]